MKKRFYVYNSWREQMELLNVEEKATMLMNLFAYQNDEEIVLDTPMLKMCWTSMKFLLEKDSEMYKQKSENMKAIGKRNRQASNDTVTTSNDTVRLRLDNDNDNDNVNVNVNKNENGKVDGDGDEKGMEWFLQRLKSGDSFKTLSIQYPQSSSLTEAIKEFHR